MSETIPTIAEASRLIAAKQLSPVELTRACLTRVHAIDKELHAFVHLTEERALADARAAERAIMAGGHSGPLHGIPIGLKDIVDTKGVPTTSGSKILQDNIPDTDAACAQKLAAAGTVLMGKLTTHEFADGGPSFDLPAPPARNPWNNRTFHRRQQQRHRCGGRGRADPRRHRYRHRRLDPRPCCLVRHRRYQADLRPRQPRRCRTRRLQPRPYRPDGVDRRGLRDDAAGACRPRPA